MLLLRRCGKIPNKSQPADDQVLRECGEDAEEEVESVLEDDGKCWDGRIGCEGWTEGFDVGPSQVDVEEEEKGAEAFDGALIYKLLVGFHRTLLESRTSILSSSSRERLVNKRCL